MVVGNGPCFLRTGGFDRSDFLCSSNLVNLKELVDASIHRPCMQVQF
jgi:hypothetical protein